ncbi:MAG: hypothetical protein H7Y18_17360 [Clostridiaceae bacterium]|nr:hypothetical protein [Clostridiaceae bacterium]
MGIMYSSGGGSKAETGFYTIEFESGMKYHCKVPKGRMEQSAVEKSTKYNDPVKSKDWTPAQNDREAFKDEYNRMQTDPAGYKDSKNYNKRQSPGKKYYEQEKK